MKDVQHVLMQDGGAARPISIVSAEPITLERGVYILEEDDAGIKLVKDRSAFIVPTQLFSPMTDLRDMFISVINQNPPLSTGTPVKGREGTRIFLHGSHGCGKSQLSEILSNHVIHRNGVCLYITPETPISYEALKKIVRCIGDREIIVYFDEFSRIYKNPAVVMGGPQHIDGQYDRILPFFSDDDMDHVNVVAASNEHPGAWASGRPKRFKYFLHGDDMLINDKGVSQIQEAFNITGSAAQYLKIMGRVLTSDGVIRLAVSISGYSRYTEVLEKTRYMNLGFSSRLLAYNFDGEPSVKTSITTTLIPSTGEMKVLVATDSKILMDASFMEDDLEEIIEIEGYGSIRLRPDSRYNARAGDEIICKWEYNPERESRHRGDGPHTGPWPMQQPMPFQPNSHDLCIGPR